MMSGKVTLIAGLVAWLASGNATRAGSLCWLGDPPRAPLQAGTPPGERRPRNSPRTLSVNVGSREEVRAFFNSVYAESEKVAMEATSQVSSCTAGNTAAAFKEAVLLRINWFRAMAGVPAEVMLDAALCAKAQQAALMMSANGTLSHSPPSTWSCYTAAGAEAAQNSNLYLGREGPEAISGYIRDDGDHNGPVGHRRWLLYPQTKTMGTGDVPANGAWAANATWVIDEATYWNPRPATRDVFVSWPPAGFVPCPVVYPRWSFSLPGADLANADVAMTRNGVPIAVELEPVEDGYGENTLVWRPLGLVSACPGTRGDTVYSVTLSNVWVGGAAQHFSYQVTAFDPNAAAPCVQQLSTNQARFGPAGGQGSVTVRTDPVCAWAALGDSPAWLGLMGQASGLGTGLVTYAVAENLTGANRVGLLLLAGADVTNTLTIQQEADVIRPAVWVTAPWNGASLGGAEVVVEGLARDDMRIERVEFDFNGQGWRTAEGTSPWSAHLTLGPGTNVLGVRSLDPTGLVSPTNTVRFVPTVGLGPPYGARVEASLSTVLASLYNLVGLPCTDTGLTNAEALARAIPHCSGVWRWDAAKQGWSGHRPGGPNNFAIGGGEGFLVSVTNAGVLALTGPWATLPQSVRRGYNLVFLSPRHANARNAEGVTQSLSSGTDLWHWDVPSQSWSGHRKGGPNNFGVEPGGAYLLYVTDDEDW